jgi:hypothetical protein
VLKALACAYNQQRKNLHSFSPALFFIGTTWDKVTNVSLSYSIKHGDQDLSLDLRKPRERWRGIEDRPTRNVFLFDISRTTPADALAGYAKIAQKGLNFGSEVLEQEMKDRLCWVMGRSYKEAKFAVKAKKRLGLLAQDFGVYSKFHQGAGEASSLDLLGEIQNVPDNSLVLIDELEASLHPKAQRRIIHTLLWLCRRKNLQLVLTTHSPYILEELPPEARILLVKGTDRQTKVIYGASSEYCLSTMDDRHHPDLSIFVEDESARIVVRELLARADADLRENTSVRVEITPVGPSNVVLSLEQLGQRNILRYPSMGIVDADCEDGGTILRLPGTMAPEREVFAKLANAGWPHVSDRLGVPAGDLIAYLEDAMRAPDHHAWCALVGNKIHASKHRVWEALVTVWVREVLDPSTVEDFAERIKDRMRGA